MTIAHVFKTQGPSCHFWLAVVLLVWQSWQQATRPTSLEGTETPHCCVWSHKQTHQTAEATLLTAEQAPCVGALPCHAAAMPACL